MTFTQCKMMRKSVIIFIVNVFAIMLYSCSRNACRVDYVYKSAYTTDLYIDSMERSDEFTKLFMHWQSPYDSSSFCISPDSRLVADSMRYNILSAENIELSCDSFIVVPDKNKGYRFVLIFPPLSKDVKIFDYIEGDTYDAFRIFGITDVLDYSKGEYLKQIPKEILEADYSDADVPEYGYGIGHTTLDVHLVSPVPIDFSNENEYELALLDFFIPDRPLQDRNYKGSIDSASTVHFEFDIAGVQRVDVYCPILNAISLYVEPCKKNEAWIDIYSYFHDKPFLYTNGRLDALNRITSYELNKYNSMLVDESLFNVSPEVFVDSLVSKVGDMTKNIDEGRKCSDLERLYCIDNIYSYYQWYIKRFSFLHKDSTRNISDADIKKFYNRVIYSDKLFPFLRYNFFYYPEYYKYLTSDEKANLESSLKFKALLDSLESDGWKNYSDTVADNIGGDFYPNAIKYYHNQYLKWFSKKVKEGVHMMKTPDVPNEELFSAIMKPFKGKRVLVDFWGVYCGPCNREIMELEPCKTDGMEYVYITTPDWSPKEEYEQYTQLIKGYHYYVSEDQWNFLREQLNFRGIPFNIYFKEDGSYTPRFGFGELDDFLKFIEERQ